MRETVSHPMNGFHGRFKDNNRYRQPFFDRTQGDRGRVKIKEIVEMRNGNEMTQVTQVTQKIK